MMRAIIQKDKLGRSYTIIDGVFCRFDRRAVYLREGAEMDCFVIQSRMVRQNEISGSRYMMLLPYVDSAFCVVTHEGFEMSGTMCTTEASLTASSIKFIERFVRNAPHWITPGLTSVRYAGNVNVGWNGHEEEPLVPGMAVMSLEDLREGKRRIAGVPTFDDIEKWMIDECRNTPRADIDAMINAEI